VLSFANPQFPGSGPRLLLWESFDFYSYLNALVFVRVFLFEQTVSCRPFFSQGFPEAFAGLKVLVIKDCHPQKDVLFRFDVWMSFFFFFLLSGISTRPSERTWLFLPPALPPDFYHFIFFALSVPGRFLVSRFFSLPLFDPPLTFSFSNWPVHPAVFFLCFRCSFGRLFCLKGPLRHCGFNFFHLQWESCRG